MKKNIYRIFTISFFVIIAFSIKCYGESDFSYTIDANGDATITAYHGEESDLTIPSMIDGHKVKTIARHTFHEYGSQVTNGHTIKNVVVSEGIENIGLLAFAKCENLETVKLPESLISMDGQVFLESSKLKSINIPSKIEIILDCVFQGTALTEIDIPENIKRVEARAFALCNNLQKVRVYSKNMEYGDEVFLRAPSNLVLYGEEGSTTQTYAQQNGITFKDLSSSDEPPEIKVGAIHLNNDKLSLKKGENKTLTVSFIEIPSDTKVIWSSSDENIATVKEGVVTAKDIGNATITVSTEDGKYKDTCTVSVVKEGTPTDSDNIPITSISLNKSSLSLYIGDTQTLVATIAPNNATDKSLVWSSSNPSIATVENGKIIAKAVGSATITVSNIDGTKKATCNVKVINKGNSSGNTYNSGNTSGKNFDNTVSKKELPKAGLKTITITSIIAIVLIAIIMYKKYNEYKDI